MTRIERINARLAATLAAINEFADESSYGSFIDDLTRHALAVRVVNKIQDADPAVDDGAAHQAPQFHVEQQRYDHGPDTAASGS